VADETGPVKGGKLDPTYQITVPEDLDGVR